MTTPASETIPSPEVGRSVRRLHQTAPIQAALLFALGGALGLVTASLFDSGEAQGAGVAVNVGVLACALGIHLTPWGRWRPRASLVLVPIAFTVIVVGQRFAPGAPTVYGVWFVLVFAWIGFWHPPRTALLFAPLGAVAYLGPFVGAHMTPPHAIASVAIVIPTAVVLGEVLASKMDTIHSGQRELVEARTLLERASLTDDLTGLGNRRRANALLDGMQPGDGLVLLDFDHFKEVNDTLGHAEGDLVLASLGEYLRSATRDADMIARFGGEEFLVLMRDAGQGIGEASCRLLSGWRERGSGVTLSAGGALHVDTRSPDATFRAADAALYMAKHQGRDRVVLEAEDDSPGIRPVGARPRGVPRSA